MIGASEVIIKTILGLMENKNIGNKQLADYLKIEEIEFAEIINFKKDLSIPILFKICRFLQTDINEILLQSGITPDHKLNELEAKDIVYFKENFLRQWSRENLNHNIN